MLRNYVFCNCNIVIVECSVSVQAFAPSGLPFPIVCKISRIRIVNYVFIYSVSWVTPSVFRFPDGFVNSCDTVVT